MNPSFSFHSEFGEDRWLAEWIACHNQVFRQGHVIDVGAAWPVHCSNTAWLREAGWKGLAIDANPAYAPEWAHTDWPFECVLLAGPGQHTARFQVHENAGWSRIAPGGQERPAETLQQVLERHGVERVSLLSIDIEGMEYEVMKGLDLERYAPWIIIAEYHTANLGKDYRLLEHLLDSGRYSVVHRTEANFIYLRR